MRARLRRHCVFWQEVWRASPGAALGALACIAIATASSYGVMIGAGHVIAALADRSDQVWRWLALTIACLFIAPIAEITRDGFGRASQAGMTTRQQALIARAALAPHGIEHLESPGSAAELRGLSDQVRSSLMLESVSSVWTWAGTRLRGLSAIVAVGHWSWLAAAILVVLQLGHSHAFTGYLRVVQEDLVEESKVEGRRQRYLLSILGTRPFAKEARLFGLTDWVLSQHNSLWNESIVGIRARRSGAVRPALLSDILMTLGNLAIMCWLAYDAWHGRVSLAFVVTAAQGVAEMRAFGPLGDTSVSVQRAFTMANAVRDLERPDGRVLDARRTPADVGRVQPPTATRTGHASSIAFQGVSFTYPTRDQAVFDNLTLAIPAGQSVAIVGVNGVGKSTLIKLLCGLYRPTTGTITIDGTDPAADDATRGKVAVIFQDFVRYQLSLRDNVGLPLIARGQDGSSARAAEQRALQLASGTDVLERVGSWDRVLDPSYDGGTDLSGGQWQRVALARALTAVEAGAGVLVLDEPTAALDVRAEAQIFERFLEVTQGVTSILVSHRLSSVRHAERIVVLGPHGIVEDDSHDNLMAAGGVYAEMFALQASRFNQVRNA